MQLKREYNHKLGHIGSVTFEIPDAPFYLDGEELPADSVEHLMMFALQTLQDAYAASDDIGLSERRERFKKKYDRILAGNIGSGGGRGPAVDDVTQEAFDILCDGNKKIAKTVKSMTGKGSAKRQREYLAKKLDENPDIRTLAQKRVDERKATLGGLNIKA